MKEMKKWVKTTQTIVIRIRTIRDQPTRRLTEGGIPIEWKEYAKYLGIHIYQKLYRRGT